MKKPPIARKGLGLRIGSAVAAVALGSCLFAASAFALDASDVTSTSDLTTSGLHTDYTSDSSLSAQSDDSTLPYAFDLRHFGGTISYTAGDSQSTITGGWSYVTPVKSQNPFGSCWSFAITAASESSMLASLDKVDNGKMDGSVNYTSASSGQSGLLAQSIVDLSERHLAYFAFYQQSSTGAYAGQNGEGKYQLSKDGTVTTDAAEVINAGGMPLLGVTVYASGIGPVPESYAKYLSDENTFSSYEITADGTDYEVKTFTDDDPVVAYANACAYVKSYWTDERLATFQTIVKQQMGADLTIDQLKSEVAAKVSSRGTWSVDEEEAYVQVAELDNSNIIPSDKDETGSMTTAEINQMKQELTEGHALSITYKADQSKPGDTITGNTYLNTETWAQYTYEAVQLNHSVTIVGYDDNYSASNFTHTVYKTDENGQLVEDEEATALTTPPGNGAWIVKNSWGASDSTNDWEKNNWGVDNSGYFYLSYYDKTIGNVESYEFDMSDEAQARTSYGLAEMDLSESPSLYSMNVPTSEQYPVSIKMMNVFGNEEVDESAESAESAENSEAAESSDLSTVSRIRDVGCLTGAAGDTVKLDIYVMGSGEDATAYVEANEPSATIESIFEYPGYHRLHLSTALSVQDNQKVAIVQTTTRPDNSNELTFIYGVNKTYADAYNACFSALGSLQIETYVNAVINKGESFVYDPTEGGWNDWSTFSSVIDQANAEGQAKQARTDTAPQYQAQADAYTAQAAQYTAAAEAATDEETKAAYTAAAQQFTANAAKYQTVANNLSEFTATTMMAIDNWSIKAYVDTAIRGDVNGNGKLNIVDAQVAYEIANDGYKDNADYETMYSMADVNGSGIVDTSDARAIQVAIMQGWSEAA